MKAAVPITAGDTVRLHEVPTPDPVPPVTPTPPPSPDAEEPGFPGVPVTEPPSQQPPLRMAA